MGILSKKLVLYTYFILDIAAILVKHMIAQLPLNIQLRDDSVLESYYAGENTQALQAITALSRGERESFVYCWGPMGVGRTHLLQAACQEAVLAGIAAVYVPLCEFTNLDPLMLQGLDNLSLVCVDDIHQIAGKPEWEEGLFHLFNRIRAVNGKLLISADVSPLHIPIVLADLKSRLAWGVVYQLQELSDEHKWHALALRAHCRGLHLNKTVSQFLLSRCSRNMAQLFHSLELLDNASLAEQRRLTIPFVKQVLGI
jgi:DnaA family protein